jgi:exodeoxyribonuclease-3
MKLASWNVNSLKVRLPQLLAWLAEQAPDIVCLQETKLEDANFPRAELGSAGYHCAWSGQKTYNGVAILSRFPISDVADGIPEFDDEQKRVISATCEAGVAGVRVVCAYVPNGQSVGSDKYEYKLRWLGAFGRFLRAELRKESRLAVLGDYNIAPAEADVHDARTWEGKVLFSQPERAAFLSLLDLGLKDSFRLFPQPERSFTWWDYRMNAFKRNMGLRIDHILLSLELATRCEACMIDARPRGYERPSDHAPVIAELKL